MDAVPHTHPRRDALKLGAIAGVTLLTVPALPTTASAATPRFRHGVASGDPLPDAVVLWTRVTPTDDALPGSGLGPTVTVDHEVAEDAAFTRVVVRGSTTTGADRDHTVKLDVSGLQPGRHYFYRFTLDGERSPVGRTKTAPAATAAVTGLRFGVVSCSNWQSGRFAAYRHLAERNDLDAVVHLGDYLYEYGPGEFGDGRPHEPAREVLSLSDYRVRHAQYKTDPELQQLHAAYPWIITIDDHEVANDAWSGGAENHTEGAEGAYATRRAVAMRAYREWMPVRTGPDGRIYRRLRFGTLAELTMLDLRTYRSQQVGTDIGRADDPDRSIAGADQLAFLRDGLVGSDARWKLVGNPVMFSPVLVPALPQAIGRPLAELIGVPADGVPINVDQWDGYQHDRRVLIDALARNNVQNTVFLTGDIHTSWAFEVPYDAALYPITRRTVATELVVPSVTSDNIDELTGAPPRTVSLAAEAALTTLNRHLKWAELDSHGYSVLDVTPERARMDWYFLADRSRADSPATLARTFTVAAGTQRLR
ncbi:MULTISPECIES: alkaline phosphatase D family protein [unclassified Saccharothrix]|uniref:alkaline phosphatase D family protein n=1 Tax=unclassified Saccharothrix TaxID=2593673 RepID=UPI00307E6868